MSVTLGLILGGWVLGDGPGARFRRISGEMSGYGLLRLEDRRLEQPAPGDVTGVGQRGAWAPLAAHSGRIHSHTSLPV